MAKELGEETITVSKQERTWRIEIFTDFGTMPTVKIYRERVELADGALRSTEKLGCFEVTAAKIAAMVFGGVTGADLYKLISAWSDGLADQQK